MTGEGRRESSGRSWTPRLAFVAVALVAVAGAYAVLSGMLGGPSPAGTRVDAALEAVTIPVEGITCGACAASIKTTLKSVAGVRAVEVNLERRTVLVRYAPGQVPPERLVAEINELGYKAILPAGPGPREDEPGGAAAAEVEAANPGVKTVTIPVRGMACESCVETVQGLLRSLPGVEDARVSLEGKEARVRYVEEVVTPERLAAAISAQGFKAGEPSMEGEQ